MSWVANWCSSVNHQSVNCKLMLPGKVRLCQTSWIWQAKRSIPLPCALPKRQRSQMYEQHIYTLYTRLPWELVFSTLSKILFNTLLGMSSQLGKRHRTECRLSPVWTLPYCLLCLHYGSSLLVWPAQTAVGRRRRARRAYIRCPGPHFPSSFPLPFPSLKWLSDFVPSLRWLRLQYFPAVEIFYRNSVPGHALIALPRKCFRICGCVYLVIWFAVCCFFWPHQNSIITTCKSQARFPLLLPFSSCPSERHWGFGRESISYPTWMEGSVRSDPNLCWKHSHSISDIIANS